MSLKRWGNYVKVLSIMPWDHVQAGGVNFTTSVQTPPNEVPFITGRITCLVIHRHGYSLLCNHVVLNSSRPSPRPCDVESERKVNTSVTTSERREMICINEENKLKTSHKSRSTLNLQFQKLSVVPRTHSQQELTAITFVKKKFR